MKTFAFACALALCAHGANASQTASAATAYVMEQMTAWVSAPVVVDAILAQNAKHAELGQGDINALDTQWRGEVGLASTPLISSVMDHPASAHLRAEAAGSGGMIHEVFVMDARGLNVASSAVTSDYWQGDEDKYIKTYLQGNDAVHVSEVEFDESTQSYVVQVSVPVADPATGEVIGAVTFGLDAQRFF